MQNKNVFLPQLQLILSMFIFGTIGVIVKNVAMPSGFVAMVRGFIGALVILIILLCRKQLPSALAIRKNLLKLTVSGALIGFNWILLFESYNYTTVAVSTLCYYMAPVFVVIASPIFLSSKVGLTKWICVIVSLLGMLLVSEPWGGANLSDGKYFIGIALALGAALLYASVTLINKKMKDISSFDMTLVQLLCAAVVIVPYTLSAEHVTAEMFTLTPVLCLLLLGVLHTGISYALFFGSVKELPADKVAIFSYIDPIVSVILSALLLNEEMSIFGVLGAVLIIASTLASELIDIKKKHKN